MSLPTLPAGAPGGAGAIVGGPALVFGDEAPVADFIETFVAGAFDEDASRGFAAANGAPGTQFHMYHDPSQILASVDSSTMAVSVDNRQLSFVAKLPPSADLASDLIGSRVVGCSSVGFIAGRASWYIGQDGRAHRDVEVASLCEISGVPLGAYPKSKIGIVGGQLRSVDSISRVPGSRAAGLTVLKRMDDQRARERAWLKVKACQALVASDHRAGKTISAATAAKLQAAIAHLQELLGNDTEPDGDEGATGQAGMNPTDMFDGSPVTGAPRPKKAGAKPDEGDPAKGEPSQPYAQGPKSKSRPSPVGDD